MNSIADRNQEKLGNIVNSLFTKSWVFETPLDKAILTVSFGWTLYTVIKGLWLLFLQ